MKIVIPKLLGNLNGVTATGCVPDPPNSEWPFLGFFDSGSGEQNSRTNFESISGGEMGTCHIGKFSRL